MSEAHILNKQVELRNTLKQEDLYSLDGNEYIEAMVN